MPWGDGPAPLNPVLRVVVVVFENGSDERLLLPILEPFGLRRYRRGVPLQLRLRPWLRRM